MENFVDLYTDYLICSSLAATATGMASLLSIKHDKITRELSKGVYDSKFLWQYSKPYIKELTQSDKPVFLSLDDSIEEKLYTDMSELVCWHYDHVFKRSVKGVNFLTALIEVEGMRLPCAVEFVKKELWVRDKKTGKIKRKASKTKNELFRDMVRSCAERCRFDYVMSDSWFSSVKNMQLVKGELNLNFIFALKSNRKAALSEQQKHNKEYINIESLQPGQLAMEVWSAAADGFSAVAY